MKKTDIVAVIAIVISSIVISYFTLSAILGRPGEEKDSESVKTTSTVKSEIEEPDPNIFNKDAINPTVQVEIGK